MAAKAAPAPPQTVALEAGHDEAAARLWRPAAQAAAKGKLLPPREAELALGNPPAGDLDKACAALQAWCWLRGLPPLDRAVSLPRVQGHLRDVADYECYFHALGFDVHSEKVVLGYPWLKVREPSAAEIGQARTLMAEHASPLAAARRLDLELELREEDAARGRKRPVPDGHVSWEDAAKAHRSHVAALAPLGVTQATLRPPGAAPYPPRPAKETSWSH